MVLSYREIMLKFKITKFRMPPALLFFPPFSSVLTFFSLLTDKHFLHPCTHFLSLLSVYELVNINMNTQQMSILRRALKLKELVCLLVYCLFCKYLSFICYSFFQVLIEEFPQPASSRDESVFDLIFKFLPAATLFSMTLIFPFLLKNIISEKETGAKVSHYCNSCLYDPKFLF